MRRQGGAIHRRQLREHEVGHRRLAALLDRGELVAVGEHVFVAASAPATWQRRAWIELLGAAPGARLGFRTAAQLHRVGRFTTSDIDLLEPEEVWHRHRAGTVHRTSWLPPHHLATVDGLPVTCLARTVFDLAALASVTRRRRGLPWLTEQQVARAMDDALARSLSLAGLHRVLGEMGRRGRPGTALARRLVAERSEGYRGTESELEDLLEAVLVAAGVDLPVRQRGLGGATPVGRVDFVYLEARVVIEVDGRAHHTALLDADADRWRDLELSAAGFIVIRVTWRQLTLEPERFVAALRQLVERRTAPPKAS
jgi:very-short-patch-repair endonuclease